MKIDWRRHRSFLWGTYEPEVVNTLCTMLSEGLVAVDVGAYVGFYTLLMSRLVGTRGLVFAFEPNPENCAVLKENVSLNNCDNVRVFQAAVLNYSGSALLTLPSADQFSPCGSVVTVDGPHCFSVKTTALDDLSFSQGPHFIKIDAEHAEALVLAGAAALLRERRPILLVELHGFDRMGLRHQAVELMENAGCRVTVLKRLPAHAHVLGLPRATR